uniref:Sulfatase n=1 Tax=Colletotrichum fructicola (strain Nara gc5) TaxID=1213859 RepID=L2FNA6_COLFN
MAPSSEIPPPYELPPKPSGLKVDKPNFIIFMPDQLRYDSLGCNGNKIVKTPRIDSFAAEGTRFTNCFVQASVCTQSRCSMFTGNYPHVSGHRSLENLIKPWEPNLFRSLKEKGGYHVACLAPRGDTFAPTVTEMSLDEYGFLETPEFVPRFAGGGRAEPEDKEDIWKRLFYKGLRNPNEALDYDDAVGEPYFSMYNRGEMGQPTKPSDKTGYEPRYMQLNRERYGTHRATPEIWAEVMATYYGMISRLDDQFGRVVERTKTLGHWDSTVTLFFTDHGEDANGDVIRHKEFAFTEGGFLTSEEPLLEQAPYPYDIKAALQHEDTTVPAELYDRAGDPGELHNLAEVAEYQDVRRRMESVVLRWMVASSDFLPWQKDPRFPAVEMESVADQFRKRGGVLEEKPKN